MNAMSCRFGKIAALSAAFLLTFLICLQAKGIDKGISVHEDAEKRSLAEPEQGFVTGQLVTVAGNIFYQHFIARWRDEPLGDRYSITVRERPTAIRGSQIKVECLNRTVFAATLPNSRGDLKNFAERAADIAYQNAFQAEAQRLLFRDADLGPDEL